MERIVNEALREARCGDWPAVRARVGALRELIEHAQRSVETLDAAAPELDPEGCIAELEDLAALLAAGAKPPPEMDLRGLQPPEPIVRIFEALERAPDEPLRAVLPHEPVPLYALLAERGFRYSGTQRSDGGFELLIERA
jgi:uncharacterized protein (DUF2249 family)